MNTFRLLGSASCAAILACVGTAHAAPLLQEKPIALRTLATEDIYFAPSLSVLSGGYFVPEFGAGVKFRGVGDPRVNLSVEGSAGLFEPGSVGELWVGSRLGFVLDDISKIEIVGNGSVGLIGGTPSYRFGFGGEIPILASTDLFVEGTAAGHFGFSPTDIGVRAGVHVFPGRFSSSFGDRILESAFNADPTIIPHIGTSISVIPTGGGAIVIPALNLGLTMPLENGLVPGLRAQLGEQLPANLTEAWLGGQIGYQATPRIQPYAFGEIGSINGVMANRIGVGTEIEVGENVSIAPEVWTRGALGAFGEVGFSFRAGWHATTANIGQRYRW